MSDKLLYALIDICGTPHHALWEPAPAEYSPVTKTSCGLPITDGMMLNCYTRRLSNIEANPDFCEMCYDAIALRVLANI